MEEVTDYVLKILENRRELEQEEAEGNLIDLGVTLVVEGAEKDLTDKLKDAKRILQILKP